MFGKELYISAKSPVCSENLGAAGLRVGVTGSGDGRGDVHVPPRRTCLRA